MEMGMVEVAVLPNLVVAPLVSSRNFRTCFVRVSRLISQRDVEAECFDVQVFDILLVMVNS